MIVNAETVFEAGSVKREGLSVLNLGICGDFGNAALAGTDQLQALEAVAPWLHACMSMTIMGRMSDTIRPIYIAAALIGKALCRN